jgi:uncharacterized protein
MSDLQVRELLLRGYCGRIATVDSTGQPYVVPLLYVLLDDNIHVHTGAVRGHFR